MSEFEVDPQALQLFAGLSTDRGKDFDEMRGQLDSVRVARDSFGYIPGIGNRVHEAYEEFVDGCADSLASAAETMAEISSAVKGVALAYLTSDDAAAESMQSLHSDLDGVGIREGR